MSSKARGVLRDRLGGGFLAFAEKPPHQAKTAIPLLIPLGGYTQGQPLGGFGTPWQTSEVWVLGSSGTPQTFELCVWGP